MAGDRNLRLIAYAQLERLALDADPELDEEEAADLADLVRVAHQKLSREDRASLLERLPMAAPPEQPPLVVERAVFGALRCAGNRSRCGRPVEYMVHDEPDPDFPVCARHAQMIRDEEETADIPLRKLVPSSE